VYSGIVDLFETMEDHAAALDELDYSEREDVVDSFPDRCQLSAVSNRVVRVRPREYVDRRDRWEIDFKSERIGNQAVESMWLKKDKYLREMYDTFDSAPHSSPLAGWVFKAIAHRVLSRGWRSKRPAPQPTSMVSDERNPPTFTANPSSPSASSNAPPSLPHPLLRGGRTIVQVDFPHGINDVTLDGGRYYCTAASNKPMFDSFIIDRDNNTAVISFFQVTISKDCGESVGSYELIRNIMAHVRGLLEEANPEKVSARVGVAYLSVRPEDASEHEWRMPTGWNQDTGRNDHRGKVFSLPI
jgi:hypothetical protein